MKLCYSDCEMALYSTVTRCAEFLGCFTSRCRRTVPVAQLTQKIGVCQNAVTKLMRMPRSQK